MRFNDKIRHGNGTTGKGRGLRMDDIVVVTGIPRSGTSMMMKMLDHGGLPVVTDHIRQPDASNPNGYYEVEKVKRIQRDAGFLHDCRGKAVKIVSELLWHLPEDHSYKLIFMLRPMREVLRSQKKMLLKRGYTRNHVGDDLMAQYFEEHLEKIDLYLNQSANIQVVYLNFSEIVEDAPATLQKLLFFLDDKLNLERMARVVDPALCGKG